MVVQQEFEKEPANRRKSCRQISVLVLALAMCLMHQDSVDAGDTAGKVHVGSGAISVPKSLPIAPVRVPSSTNIVPPNVPSPATTGYEALRIRRGSTEDAPAGRGGSHRIEFSQEEEPKVGAPTLTPPPKVGRPRERKETEAIGGENSTTSTTQRSTPQWRTEGPATGQPARPQAPYLFELAMEIDKPLTALTWESPQMALELYRGALKKADAEHDLEGRSMALTNLGHIFYLTGQFPRAEHNYQMALSVSRRLKDPHGEAVALRNLGATYTGWGNFLKANDVNRQALTIFQQTGDKKGEQMTWNNLGVVSKNSGRYLEALDCFEKSLEVNKKPSSTTLVAMSNLARFHQQWGAFTPAKEMFRQSADTAEKIPDPKGQVDGLSGVAQAETYQGRYTEAIDRAREALDVAKRNRLPTPEIERLVGDLYLEIGKYGRAESHLKRAGDDSSLGLLYLKKSEVESADHHYARLLATADKNEDLEGLFAAYTGRGKVLEARKQFSRAEECYAKAMEITERMRSALLLSERRNFFETRVKGFALHEPAKGLVRVLLKQKKASQSVYPSEVTRARSFADNLASKTEGQYFNVPPQVLIEESAITNRLASLKKAMRSLPREVDEERYEYLSSLIRDAEAELNAFVDSLRGNHTDYAQVKYPEPVDLEKSAVRQDEFVILLDCLGEGVGIRLIKGKQVLKADIKPWPQSDMERDIKEFRRPFEDIKLGRFRPELAQSMYEKLLADSLELIPENTPVTIIPDGLLAILPFDALVVGGQVEWKKNQWGQCPFGLKYLGDRNPITYYQSLSAMTLVRRLAQARNQSKKLLVMADPVYGLKDARLDSDQRRIEVAGRSNAGHLRMQVAFRAGGKGIFPLGRLEMTGALAHEMETLYGGDCVAYTGLQCDKGIFLKKLATNGIRYRSIIFAMHGFAANRIPGIMEPFLALTLVPEGTDGLLTMSEVSGLKLDLDLAVLTGCQTGMGMELAGEGIMSMGRAFQCAGARSVLMSLWSVFEGSSVMLTEQMLRSIREGKNKREALKLARSHVRSAGYEHPFFWSAFVLVGEGD